MKVKYCKKHGIVSVEHRDLKVRILENDEDWQFVFIDAWKDTDQLTIKKQMSVF